MSLISLVWDSDQPLLHDPHICCTCSVFRSRHQPIITTQVGLARIREDKEAFAIVSVPSAEVRDLDFANDACLVLKEAVVQVKSGALTLNGRK